MNNPRDENYILNGIFITLKKLCTTCMSVYLRIHRLSGSRGANQSLSFHQKKKNSLIALIFGFICQTYV